MNNEDLFKREQREFFPFYLSIELTNNSLLLKIFRIIFLGILE